ncbi:MAG: copper chaperone PCu(A)C [Alphaproteobacteria bacterium]|nr:copper chaperone PCu(A)C [Alphaproteobacteria bacterium]
MRTLFSRFCFVVALLCSTSAAFAHSAQQGDIQIGHIWARATAKGADAGSVYVPLLNKGKTDDALVNVTTPAAASAMLHESKMVDGVSSMTMLDTLPLPVGKPVAMRPGGKHIMLMGLKQQLVEGQNFPLTLKFQHAGEATVLVMVHGAGAKAGDH